MAEPFAKPTKEQLKQALVLYGDPILYWATNTAVRCLNDMKDTDFDLWEQHYSQLRWLLRRFIERFGLFQIQELVYEINVEIADDYWKNFQPPRIKLTEYEKKPISKEWRSG